MNIFSKLTTESNNSLSKNIDRMSSVDIVKLMNEEDNKTIMAVGNESDHIAKGIDIITKAFKKGGRLFYCGCGTSGRLGVLDASECPPTFGTDPQMVIGLIAGGDIALRNAVEAAEDNIIAGKEDLKAMNLSAIDVVVGISASGFTPYVLGALEYAKKIGAKTIGVCNNKDSKMIEIVNVLIALDVGAEVIQGSTRLKSGTSQKMVLNMLSTGAMVKLGKVYGNLMVDMKASNNKLFDRAIRLVEQSTACVKATAETALKKCNYHVKTAIIMVLTGLDEKESNVLLELNKGYVHKALGEDNV